MLTPTPLNPTPATVLNPKHPRPLKVLNLRPPWSLKPEASLQPPKTSWTADLVGRECGNEVP